MLLLLLQDPVNRALITRETLGGTTILKNIKPGRHSRDCAPY